MRRIRTAVLVAALLVAGGWAAPPAAADVAAVRTLRVYNNNIENLVRNNADGTCTRVSGPDHLTSMLVVPRHAWKIFRDYEYAGLECPVATVLGHHPAFNMGAAYRGRYEADEY